MEGLLKDIKNAVKNAGSNKGKFVYFKADSKVRIRFLQDVEDGIKITFHDSFALGVNVPCQLQYGRECPQCSDEDLRTRDLFAWSAYDYDANEVKVVMAAVNAFSPIPALIGMYEEYGTLLDRDYVISRSGAGTSTSYTVVPMDKAAFKNKKAKPLSNNKKILQIVDKAYPGDESEDDDGEEAPVVKTKKKKAAANKQKEEEEETWDDTDDDSDTEYDELSVKELYQECVKRDIKAEKKKKAKYYIDKLEAADDAEANDDDEDEEDDW